jgi:hypothetical protein
LLGQKASIFISTVFIQYKLPDLNKVRDSKQCGNITEKAPGLFMYSVNFCKMPSSFFHASTLISFLFFFLNVSLLCSVSVRRIRKESADAEKVPFLLKSRLFLSKVDFSNRNADFSAGKVP